MGKSPSAFDVIRPDFAVMMTCTYSGVHSTASATLSRDEAARVPRSNDGIIAVVLRIANHWYALVRPVVNSILSASLMAGGFDDEIIEEIKGYGTVKVMMRIARFRLSVKPMKKKVALKPEAIPLRWGGTAPIIELMLGELKRPIPAPKMTRSSAN